MGNVLQAYLLNIADYWHYTRKPSYTSDIIFCCREKCTLHYKTALLLPTLTPSFRSFFVISYFLQLPTQLSFYFYSIRKDGLSLNLKDRKWEFPRQQTDHHYFVASLKFCRRI